MQHYRDIDEIRLDHSWLTIGSYDGVHTGHQQIIRALVAESNQQEQPAVVITFHPHPTLVIKDESRPFYLTLPEKRAQYLGQFGVNIILTYPFTKQTSRMSPRDFLSLLHQHFNFSQLWIGHDFTLGKDREGDAARLRELGQVFGYTLVEIPPLFNNGELVSSSLIRKNLREGDIRRAAELLGRPFEITGKVIPGENRGKGLGFATSNLEVPREMVDMKPGVYACWSSVRGQTWKAVSNIGFRPTFGGGINSPRFETHLLDFSGDLYGENLSVQFIERLRDERKFNKVSDLQTQVQLDIDKTRQILGD